MAVNQERSKDPQLVFDLRGENLGPADLRKANLSGADLRDTDLTQCKLQEANLNRANLAGACLPNNALNNASLVGANLSNTDLRSINFPGANLQTADLSNSDCTSANFNHSNLLEINVTPLTNFSSANFTDATLDRSLFNSRLLQGARLQSQSLSGLNLSRRDLTKVDLTHAKLVATNLKGSDLTDAVLTRADLTEVKLRGSLLIRSRLDHCTLTGADISYADFYEAVLDGASMASVVGALDARNLVTTSIQTHSVRYFDDVLRPWPERWVDWERLRLAGRLPLFGASYTALIVIPLYVYAIGIYNDKLEGLRALVIQLTQSNNLSGVAARPVLDHLHTEPIPESLFILFISTICLAIAATIYALACPSRIKEFSRDQWCDEFQRSLVHYWPLAWRWRYLRLICAALYILGGLLGGYVLIQKLWRVGYILYHSPLSP